MAETTPEPLSPFKRSVQHEAVSLEHGPVRLFLHEDELVLLDPRQDIAPELQSELETDADMLIVDATTFDPAADQGFKALQDGEELVLGRQHDLGRFEFSDTTSRAHTGLARKGDQVLITDLHSTNGTYLAGFPLTRHQAARKLGQAATTRLGPAAAERPNQLLAILAGASLASDYHPRCNEDAYFINQGTKALGVFDGVSSDPGSEMAASIAAKTIDTFLAGTASSLPRAMSSLAIREALQSAHQAVNAESPGTATTAAIAKLFTTESHSNYAVVGSAGDSRVYLFRQGHMEHITLDHAYVGAGLSDEEAKVLQRTLANATVLSRLSKTERLAFKKRNIITSHLGGSKNPTITVADFEVFPGDQILITSDGIHDNLTDEEVQATVREAADEDSAVQTLAEAARQRSQEVGHIRAKPDDMTAVMLGVEAGR